jgi:predicted TIM-barrel fold metal-dependent hydrolase
MRANMADPDGTILRDSLAESGIEHAFVIGLDWGLALGDDSPEVHPSRQLDWAQALLAHHADGFFSFAFGIDPRRPEAVEYVQQAFAAGAVGVKIYPPAGFRPDAEVCDPVYDAVVAANGFVIAHTGRQTYPFDLEKGRVEPYAAVQRRHPDLKLVLGHAGVPFWGYEAIEVAKGHPTTFLEVSGWHKLIDHEPERVRQFLRRAWEELGPTRVLFGSDLVSGPAVASRMPLLHRWIELYESTAQEAGVDSIAAGQAGLRELTTSTARRTAATA